MASTTDDAFHEIQLNGKQLVFLFMAVVVVSVVIFLCGVLVGRGVRGESSGPVEASAAPGVPDAVADAPPSVTPPGTPAAANEDLSYPGRLAASGPARESLKPSEAAKPAPPSPASAPAANPPLAAPPVADAPAAPSEPAGAGFAIQVAALRQRAEADTVARGLSSKGYPAYVLSPDAGAPPVFRVRVGKFKDRREAESVAARLQKEEQFKPWIVR